MVISGASTVLGFELACDPVTQFPHVKFGMERSFFTVVPTGLHRDGSGDASEAVSMMASLDVSLNFLSGVSIIDRFAINPNRFDTNTLLSVMSTPSRLVK